MERERRWSGSGDGAGAAMERERRWSGSGEGAESQDRPITGVYWSSLSSKSICKGYSNNGESKQGAWGFFCCFSS